MEYGMTLSFGRERFGIAWLEDHYLHDVRANTNLYSDNDIREQAIRHRLETSILTMDEDVFEASWPTDWWEAVKQRFAPGWFLKWWPVTYQYIREPKYGKVFLSVFPDKTTKFEGQRVNVHHFDGVGIA